MLPYNTILVYSFSKLYGVTGWRVGLIAMNRNNICDHLLGDLPEVDKAFLRQEYSIVTTDSDSMPFLERVVADSRSIGLYHTSGLSTLSQVFMDMLALSHLVYVAKGEEDPYIRLANDTVHERYEALMKALGLAMDECATNTQYYTLIDVYDLVKAKYGEDFLRWLQTEKTDLDLLNDLARRKGVVLMYGPGFKAPAGTVRISLANLNTEDYTEIAKRLFELLDEYLGESGIGLANAA